MRSMSRVLVKDAAGGGRREKGPVFESFGTRTRYRDNVAHPHRWARGLRQYNQRCARYEPFRVGPAAQAVPRDGGCDVSIHKTMPTLTLGRRKRRHAVGFSAKYSIRSRMPERLEETSTHSALDIGTATDVGRVRAANEDSLLALLAAGPREGQVLVAVADGMGGHKAGEVASALAIEALR